MKTDKKIIKYSQLPTIRKKARLKNKVIVLTTGCYDILHLGHLIHFDYNRFAVESLPEKTLGFQPREAYCKSKGDILVVSVGNDKTVKALKGPNRPINNELFRARILAGLAEVDFVIISQEFGIMDHNKIVELLRPDVYVVPGTDSMLEEKRKLIKKIGSKFITCRRLPPAHLKGGISTTQIGKKITDEKS